MRYYETLYIANPNYEQDRLVQLMESVANELKENKVSIINHYMWSKKRLAYLIEKYKYGTFIILHFEAEKFDFLKDFETYLKLDKSILRHQTILLDKKPDKHDEKMEEISKDKKKEDQEPDDPVETIESSEEKMEHEVLKSEEELKIE
jgi:small subunit ribosomal protein S6|tara:strand:+ start:735 stop:1178 length:444 start_codon:yes stop_codon:yes gene_type:complete